MFKNKRKTKVDSKIKKYHELTDSDKDKIREVLRNTGHNVMAAARITKCTKHAVTLTAAGAW